MLGRRQIPPHFLEWNQKWQAPVGPSWGNSLNFEDKFQAETARRLGPFAYQPNNTTRVLEYPWAFERMAVLPGLNVLEIGGALSGLQFALAQHGAKVTNVDPFRDYGGADDYPTNPETLHAQLNGYFRTDVKLERATLTERRFEPESFDRAVCVSTIEHMPADEICQTMREVRRILKPWALFVLTVDLFLDLFPFTREHRNRWGTNVSIRWLLQQSRLKLVWGNRNELFGYSEFNAEQIKSHLDEYMVGEYPALVQLLVLRK